MCEEGGQRRRSGCCVSIERDEREWGTTDCRRGSVAASRLPLLFGGAADRNPGGRGPGRRRGVADLPDDALGAGAGVYGAGAVSAGAVLYAAGGTCGGSVRSQERAAGVLCAAVWRDAVAAGYDDARREQRGVDLRRAGVDRAGQVLQRAGGGGAGADAGAEGRLRERGDVGLGDLSDCDGERADVRRDSVHDLAGGDAMGWLDGSAGGVCVY